MQQPAARPPAATRSTTTRSTGTITAKSIGNRRRRAGRRAGRTTRPCATTTTETRTFTMIVTRTPPAPARGEDIRMIFQLGVILYRKTFWYHLDFKYFAGTIAPWTSSCGETTGRGMWTTTTKKGRTVTAARGTESGGRAYILRRQRCTCSYHDCQQLCNDLYHVFIYSYIMPRYSDFVSQ